MLSAGPKSGQGYEYREGMSVLAVSVNRVRGTLPKVTVCEAQQRQCRALMSAFDTSRTCCPDSKEGTYLR